MADKEQQAQQGQEKEFRSTIQVLRSSANYVFKQKYGKYTGMALLISLIGHIAFILAMPALNPEIQVQEQSEMEAVELPPEVVIPPPPQQLAKPSIPQMAEEEVDEDITIEETTPPPPDLIPEIPVNTGEEDQAEEFLMVAETMPKFKSVPPKPKMPSYISRARVDVTTVIEFFVTRTGDVDQQRTKIVTSSGYPELDEIAVEWAKQIKFHPALNRGEPVPVRVRVPVQWKSN